MSEAQIGVETAGRWANPLATNHQRSSGFRKKIFWVHIQRWIGLLAMVPFCGLLILMIKWYFKFKIENHAELRKLYRQLTRDRTPLMICANHLTYIDSILMIYAFANHWRYTFNYRLLSWNLPALEYSKVFFFRLVGLTAKCIFIDRGGSPTHHREILDVVRYWLERGEPVTIFPEGKRSRIGRFDDRKLAYGIGKIISHMKECRVLCVYMRGDRQDEYSNFPKKGSRFRLSTELLHLRPQGNPRENVSIITRQIADQIKKMEEEYFQAAASQPTS